MPGWSRYLVVTGKKRRLNFAQEEAQFARFEQTLRPAKLEGQVFELKASRVKSDQAFLHARKLKDKLAKRVR